MTIYEFAIQHKDDLRLSVYITAHSVERLFSTSEGRREAISLMRANGITKAYIEVYRSGMVVSPDLLEFVTTYFKQNGFEVVGGIATVPGKDFGVKQEGQLGWFNWQNPKTQQDLKQVMLNAAPHFDTFIVDDFLCTGDTSVESKVAKGERSWSTYRRQLLTELATSIFIEPAKSVNPDIHMIIKYPQWYDRFHMFGYDIESGPQLFDEVWVGTETRGQYTQRFGFVQPYEGFVNYQWIASLAGNKIGGAWFDHGDCDPLDFIEQAYQSVLAGASELVIFNYDSFVEGYAGHHLLRMDFEKLAALAKEVKSSPVHGISGYKPPQSDAGGDLYIMDFIGMFGIPLLPVSSYPENASTIFLPAQAAHDPEIIAKVMTSHQQGKRIIMTTGFLATVDDQGQLAKLAGISKPGIEVMSAERILVGGEEEMLERPLDLEANLIIDDADVLLEAKAADSRIPFLTQSRDQKISVLNSHTFSEDYFQAVGEVLLCPRPLGMLDLPKSWTNVIRSIFNDELRIKLDAPTRITMQPLKNGDIVLHNYNPQEIEIQMSGLNDEKLIDQFQNDQLIVKSGALSINMKPRSRIWLRKDK
ncbi:MAG: hypothetical protein IPL46_06235 [Saprospiraceae bacterium]|nr:hypothetical protein [Saprospiraceae bacterium]